MKINEPKTETKHILARLILVLLLIYSAIQIIGSLRSPILESLYSVYFLTSVGLGQTVVRALLFRQKVCRFEILVFGTTLFLYQINGSWQNFVESTDAIRSAPVLLVYLTKSIMMISFQVQILNSKTIKSFFAFHSNSKYRPQRNTEAHIAQHRHGASLDRR